MAYYPPVIHPDNTAYSDAFDIVKEKLRELTLQHFNIESYTGLSYDTQEKIHRYRQALTYCHLIYLRDTDDYYTKTLEEIKEEFDYDTVNACFACKGIDLDAILAAY